MKKILILGEPGSGKTFFSVKLSKKLNIPVYHLDHYYYKPNWVVVDRVEFIAKQKEIIQYDKWIIDDNSITTLAERLEKSDIVIFLDIPRYLRVCRVLYRNYILNKPTDLPPGCTFTWRQFFMFLKNNVWSFDTHRRDKILRIIAAHPQVTFLHICSSQEANSFLAM